MFVENPGRGLGAAGGVPLTVHAVPPNIPGAVGSPVRVVLEVGT